MILTLTMNSFVDENLKFIIKAFVSIRFSLIQPKNAARKNEEIKTFMVENISVCAWKFYVQDNCFLLKPIYNNIYFKHFIQLKERIYLV